jgi:hypothetical protein
MSETDKNSIQYKADVAFTHFRIWCHINETTENETNFKIYVKSIKKGLDFWVKKQIAEVYFGYKYTYNYKTNQWQGSKEKRNERQKNII